MTSLLEHGAPARAAVSAAVSAATTADAGWCWRRTELRAMGAGCQLLVWADSDEPLRWALRALASMEHTWSRFRPDSELNHVNANAGAAVRTSALLRRAVSLAVQCWRDTGGLFDPTIHDALVGWGYDVTFDVVRTRPAPVRLRASSVSAPGANEIVIDDDAATVRVPRGVRLDLGGIGKGLAADLLVEGMLARGAGSVSVGMGGDVRTGGIGPDGGAWEITVEDPDDDSDTPRPLFTRRLDTGGGAAITCSTTGYRRWSALVPGAADVTSAHHIIDPRTGAPSGSGVRTAVVQGPYAAQSEAWAKALVVGGALGMELLQGQGLKAWVVHDDGFTESVPVPAVRSARR